MMGATKAARRPMLEQKNPTFVLKAESAPERRRCRWRSAATGDGGIL